MPKFIGQMLAIPETTKGKPMTKDIYNLVTIGDRVKYLREEVRKMRPGELAKALGIAQASLHQIESGSTKSPSAETLLKLTVILNANPFWIIEGKGDPLTWPKVEGKQAGELVSMFNAMPEERKAVLLATCIALYNQNGAP